MVSNYQGGDHLDCSLLLHVSAVCTHSQENQDFKLSEGCLWFLMMFNLVMDVASISK